MKFLHSLRCFAASRWKLFTRDVAAGGLTTNQTIILANLTELYP